MIPDKKKYFEVFVNWGLPVSYQLFHKIKMNPVFLVHNSYKLGYIVLTFKNIKPVMNISKIYFYLNSCIREIVSFLCHYAIYFVTMDVTCDI